MNFNNANFFIIKSSSPTIQILKNQLGILTSIMSTCKTMFMIPADE